MFYADQRHCCAFQDLAVLFYDSGAGIDKNRALLDTSIKLCRTTYWYELFAKYFQANQKSPYFQNGGPEFKMAAKICPKAYTFFSQ